MSVLSFFDKHGQRIAQIDGDGGVAHVVREYGVPVSITVTVRCGDLEFGSELPVCANALCSRCHPAAFPNGEPVQLPSAFAYLLGEPHA